GSAGDRRPAHPRLLRDPEDAHRRPARGLFGPRPRRQDIVFRRRGRRRSCGRASGSIGFPPAPKRAGRSPWSADRDARPTRATPFRVPTSETVASPMRPRKGRPGVAALHLAVPPRPKAAETAPAYPNGDHDRPRRGRSGETVVGEATHERMARFGPPSRRRAIGRTRLRPKCVDSGRRGWIWLSEG